MLRITYFSTFYKKEVTMLVNSNEVVFDQVEHRVVFATMGYRYAIEMEYINKIDVVEA